MTLWLCILVRIVANPFSNVFQKVLVHKAASPLLIIGITHALLSLACLPLFAIGLSPLGQGFWTNIVACTILAVAGNVLLVQALKLSDLSILGPINAYKSVISLVPAALLLGEFPGPLGLAGIAAIVVGSYFLLDKDPTLPKGNAFARLCNDRGVRYRFAALVLNATEAIFLKKALLASSPLTTFVYWSVLGFGVFAVAAAVVLWRSRKGFGHEIRLIRTHMATSLLLAATTGLMQLCTLVTLESLQVGYSLALFQTSTILAVVLGHTVFREPHFVQRLVGSLVMVSGAVLIVLGG